MSDIIERCGIRKGGMEQAVGGQRLYPTLRECGTQNMEDRLLAH
ncbi:hypothetical protein [Paenibacillus albicereus]|nr:hypothetical protein [Paenibacillus albicereus]